MLHHDNAPAHASLLIREFFTKHEKTLVPQPPDSPDLTPADFSKVQILSKRSSISDDRRDRRKFNAGPSRHPTKQVPGRVPELEKSLGRVYQEWSTLKETSLIKL